MLGIPIPNEEALRARLKQAIENSRRKRYHGNDDNMAQLPKLDEQAKAFLEEKVKPFEFYDEATKEWLAAESPKWQQAVLDKFPAIRQLHTNVAPGEELEPKDYALLSDEDHIEPKDFNAIKAKNDVLRRHINLQNNGKFITTVGKTTVSEDYPATFTWRELFIKLCFEQMLKYFPQHQDFKLFYQYIDVAGPLIHTLRLKILDKMHFKSNNYYLMALIGRLKALKVLKLHKDSIVYLGVDGFKYMQKGFKYFSDNGGSLVKLQVNNILGQTSDEYLYTCLKCLPELRILKINDTPISLKDAQTIGRVLSDFKAIQEIDLTNCQLDQPKSKEIADGLMRAKQLQIIKMGKNSGIGRGADAILYNLAFSPRITHIDLSDDLLNSADTAEAIYKLVKISGSLETLIL
jgi:hypothetical protein